MVTPVPTPAAWGLTAPAPIVTESLMDRITREILVPVVDGMNRQGFPYRGILYAGLMMTSGGPRVLEFNVPFRRSRDSTHSNAT